MTDLDKFITDLKCFADRGDGADAAVIYDTVAHSLLLAIEIADNCSIADIESVCPRLKIHGAWYYNTHPELDREQRDPEEIRLFGQSLTHLRNRGMLFEDPNLPGWVTFQDADTPLP